MGSRWCLRIEALRAASQDYRASQFPDPVSDLVDEERREAFEGHERHFESRYFLTFTYLPPEEAVSTAESLLLENAPSGRGAAGMYRATLSDFLSTVRQIADILTAIMPEVHELSDDETLTYLHGCISTKRHYVKAPETPAYLDAFLTDDDFQGGLLPRLGGSYVRTISVRAYPATSSPGLLDRLNELGISYRWVCRFLPLDKEDARKAVTTVRKRWFAKRKGVMALLKEAITREPSVLEDPDAAAKSMDADPALAILGGDYASIGYFTPTVTLMDTDPDRLADRVRIGRHGVVAYEVVGRRAHADDDELHRHGAEDQAQNPDHDGHADPPQQARDQACEPEGDQDGDADRGDHPEAGRPAGRAEGPRFTGVDHHR